MSVDVIMPQMGESIAEGTITKWLKKVGDTVKRDEPLFEISTDKVDAEIPSPAAGVLSEILVGEGKTVGINTVVGRIGAAATAGASAPAAARPAAPAAVQPVSSVAATPSSAPVRAATGGSAKTVDVVMPQMGESIAEGTITRWIRKVGDTVKRDEPIFEISTDKVDAEIPSPAAGVLAEILVAEGKTVEVNKIVARIAAEGTVGAATSTTPRLAVSAVSAAAPPRPAAAVAAVSGARTSGAADRGSMSREDLRRTRSSPLVRKIAAERNVDISALSGTGISGRVTKNDILAYLEKGGSAAAVTPAGSASAPPMTTGISQATAAAFAPKVFEGDRVEPMTAIRRKTAEHMIYSKHTSAHVTSYFEVDLTNVARLRDKHKKAFEAREGAKLTFMPFIAKAAVDAMQRHPVINSSVAGDSIIYHKNVNLGIAVAMDRGLIVPVIRKAEEKNLIGLARAISDLSERARGKKLLPDEVAGGTFTITNVGGFGSFAGSPVINQPQVAIMGVGIIEKRPVVIDDAIAIRTMCMLSLSFDHRVVDGADSGRYMAYVKELLQAANFTDLGE